MNLVDYQLFLSEQLTLLNKALLFLNLRSTMLRSSSIGLHFSLSPTLTMRSYTGLQIELFEPDPSISMPDIGREPTSWSSTLTYGG